MLADTGTSYFYRAIAKAKDQVVRTKNMQMAKIQITNSLTMHSSSIEVAQVDLGLQISRQKSPKQKQA
jgi:hypothetical protein